MTKQKLGVAIVGCGNIARPYGETLKPYTDQIELIGASDLFPERAQAFTAEFGGKAYASLEALLADSAVDLVINLTIHHAHPEVITQCLEAGKYVYSEKPLALNYEDAKRLVDLAEEKGLRLSGAPITYMGEAQQTAWKMIRDGWLGEVRVVYAEVNWGRIESWHPNPLPFYDVGPLFDVGVYPLTLLTTIFGPARRVTAYGRVVYPDRMTNEGKSFHLETPEFTVAAIELEGGPVVRLTANFYVGNHSKQKGLEFHGDRGSLYLDSFQNFNASVEYAQFAQPYEPVPYVKTPYEGTEWCRAVVEMAEAMAEGRPHRATGAQAAHVVEILTAVSTSAKEGKPVAITSEFPPPTPMDWAQ